MHFLIVYNIAYRFETWWDLHPCDTLGTTLDLGNENVFSPSNQEQELIQNFKDSEDSQSLRLEKSLKALKPLVTNCGVTTRCEVRGKECVIKDKEWQCEVTYFASRLGQTQGHLISL